MTGEHRAVDLALTLHAAATPRAPALLLRPWHAGDVPELVEAHQDAALRHWTSFSPGSTAEGACWVADQRRGWSAGDRFAFAVLETRPGRAAPQLAGGVVLKDVAPGSASAGVGYWTAAHARGRSVASRALDALTGWAFATFRADGLEALELLHQVDNHASCAVARKSGYALDRILPPAPPAYPLDGHLHLRRAAS